MQMCILARTHTHKHAHTQESFLPGGCTEMVSRFQFKSSAAPLRSSSKNEQQGRAAASSDDRWSAPPLLTTKGRSGQKAVYLWLLGNRIQKQNFVQLPKTLKAVGFECCFFSLLQIILLTLCMEKYCKWLWNTVGECEKIFEFWWRPAQLWHCDPKYAIFFCKKKFGGAACAFNVVLRSSGLWILPVSVSLGAPCINVMCWSTKQVEFWGKKKTREKEDMRSWRTTCTKEGKR